MVWLTSFNLSTMTNNHPDVSREQALRIIASPRTINTIAILARQTHRTSLALIDQQHGVYDLSHDEEAIDAHVSIYPNPHNGCPAVDMKNGMEP